MALGPLLHTGFCSLPLSGYGGRIKDGRKFDFVAA